MFIYLSFFSFSHFFWDGAQGHDMWKPEANSKASVLSFNVVDSGGVKLSSLSMAASAFPHRAVFLTLQYIYYDTIHNSQTVKPAYMSINTGIDKETTVCVHSKLLFQA